MSSAPNNFTLCVFTLILLVDRAKEEGWTVNMIKPDILKQVFCYLWFSSCSRRGIFLRILRKDYIEDMNINGRLFPLKFCCIYLGSMFTQLSVPLKFKEMILLLLNFCYFWQTRKQAVFGRGRRKEEWKVPKVACTRKPNFKALRMDW